MWFVCCITRKQWRCRFNIFDGLWRIGMCLLLPGKCGMVIFERLNRGGAVRVIECNNTFLEMVGGADRREVVGHDTAQWLAEEYADLQHRKALTCIRPGEAAGGVCRWARCPQKDVAFVVTRVSVCGKSLYLVMYQWKLFVEHGCPGINDFAHDGV